MLSLLAQRGHAFLQRELTLAQLPRLVSRGAFAERFEKQVLADTAEQLERAVLEAASWMEARV